MLQVLDSYFYFCDVYFQMLFFFSLLLTSLQFNRIELDPDVTLLISLRKDLVFPLKNPHGFLVPRYIFNSQIDTTLLHDCSLASQVEVFYRMRVLLLFGLLMLISCKILAQEQNQFAMMLDPNDLKSSLRMSYLYTYLCFSLTLKLAV